MRQLPETVAQDIFRAEWERLSPHEREVIEGILHRVSIPRDPNAEFQNRRTLGERAADALADFGGSWTFILIFIVWLAFWAVLNTEILGPHNTAFDPYPYIFLNLILSMLAAIQAPIIMMSQNRQSELDRRHAETDYEINVKAELEIELLHEKIDILKEQELLALTEAVQALSAQLETLTRRLPK